MTMKPKLAKKIVKGPVTEGLIGSTIEDEEMVCRMIHETMPQLEVIEMQTVKNTFLEAMYLLKKEEYKSRYGKVPEEKLLFHVTAASNVDSIITNNFDWRRTTRGKFGLGTSFSGDAGYADRYANYNIGDERAIILSKVLVSKTTIGHHEMKIPRKKYDTATGNDDKVYVKFGDNEILPKYVVFYSLNVSQVNKSIKKKSTQKKQHTDSKSSKANNNDANSKSSKANNNDANSGKVFNNYDYYDYDNEEYGSDEYEDGYDEDEEGDCDEDCEEEEFCEEEEWENCEEEEDEYEYCDEECEEEEDEYYDDECEEEEEEECEEEEDEDEECEEEEDENDYYDEDSEAESDNYYYY